MSAATETTIGPYRVLRSLGRGAHGEVFLACHPRDPERHVAIKLIECGANLDRTLLEPGILSQLRHPNVVTLHDYFVDRGRVALVLEYVPHDLDAVLRGRLRFTVEEVWDFLRQMARALAAAHARRVLHRDIKPGNVLVDFSGAAARYVLSDFGIARIAEGVQLVRRAGGTHRFMAPEQIRGRPCEQSDLWGLGVVAYLMLRGALPFQGGTLQELTQAVMYVTPPPATGGAHPEMDRMIYRLLEKSLEARVASATELCRELGVSESGELPSAGRASASLTWEQAARQEIWQMQITIACGIVFASIPSGVVGSLLAAGAAYLVYLAYQKEETSPGLLLAATVPLGLGFLANASVDPDGVIAREHPALVVLWSVVWTFLLSRVALSLQRKRRDLHLLLSVREHAADPDRVQSLLRAYVRRQPGDVEAYQKYVESLLATGRTREAAAESCLMLERDPCNVGGRLLLANAYFALGLFEACVGVCDSTLEMIGYCFEFSDLRERSQEALRP